MIVVSNDFYTLDEVAEKLKASGEWVGEQIAKGDLQVCKRGRRSYVLHSDLIAFIESGRLQHTEKSKREYKPNPPQKGRKPKNTEG